jgi:energy-converting hydrogenase Eha subunit G
MEPLRLAAVEFRVDGVRETADLAVAPLAIVAAAVGDTEAGRFLVGGVAALMAVVEVMNGRSKRVNEGTRRPAYKVN